VRAYYEISEAGVPKRIFEMVKATGATRHIKVRAGRKWR
jgi:hypothetical protein